MTVGSCSNFHKDVLACIETATPAALHVESQVGAYQEASGLLASVVNRDRAFVATKSMESADRERDNAAGVVINVTYDFLSSPVEVKRTAAELLYPKLSPYKGIGRHEYTKETAEIDGMLKVFDDEACASAAETMGINIVRVKRTNFIIAAMICGFVGSFYAQYVTFIHPTSFTSAISQEYAVMAIFGGLGSIPGTFLGCIVLTLLPEVLRGLLQYRLLIYGALMVLMMNIKPTGILGNLDISMIKRMVVDRRKEEKTLDKGGAADGR